MTGAWRVAPWKRTTVAIAMVALVLEGGSALAIALVGKRLDEPIRRVAGMFREQSVMLSELLAPGDRLLRVDSTLGWRYRAGFASGRDHTNTQGLRASREYDVAPPAGVLRVAAFGDSFVYGNEVDDASAWPAQIEALGPGIEILNYGVGGYGLDQAFLRYLDEGSRLAPHIVLVGFVVDDLGRLVNVYRRFLSSRELPLFKPRFALDGRGQLALMPNPMAGEADYRRLIDHPRSVLAHGRSDAWYAPLIYENPLYDWSASVRLAITVWLRVRRRYLDPQRMFVQGELNHATPAFALQVAVFEEFARAVRRAGAEPVIVFLPDRQSLAQLAVGRRAVYVPLLERMRARGASVLDAALAFPAGPPSADWFMRGGHYSPAGNRLVALWLREQLMARRPLPPRSGPEGLGGARPGSETPTSPR